MTAWYDVELGSVCEFKYGKSLPAAKRDGGDFPVYGSNGIVGWHSEPLAAGPTVVIGRKGSFGEIAYSEVACWPIDTTYYVDSSTTSVDLRWLAYRLDALGLTELNGAAAVPGLNREDAYRQRLLLPPMGEQRRIAGILDQAYALRAKRRRVLTYLDSLTQSIFHDMFGGVAQTKMLGDLVAEFRYGTSVKADTGGNPALRIPNVIGGTLDVDDLKTVPVTPAEQERLRLTDGDVLVVRSNGNPDYVGRCAVFGRALVAGTGYDADCFVYASYLIRVRPNLDVVNGHFLSTFLGSIAGRRALRERAKTSAGQYNINAQGLSTLPIPAVSIGDQQVFVDRVAKVTVQRAAVKHALAADDELVASLESRAFRGEL